MEPYIFDALNDTCYILPRAKLPNGLILNYETCPENFDNTTLKLVKYCCFFIIYGITQKLNMDKKDVIAFFQEMRIFFMTNIQTGLNNNAIEAKESAKSGSSKTIEKDKIDWMESNMEEVFEQHEISKLDIRRMYRYLDKNVKKDVAILSLDNDDDIDEE